MVKILQNIKKSESQKAMQLLGQAIRQRRKILQLTQGDLAAMAGMSKNLVCQIESGKMTVQTAKLLDLLDVLGLHFVLDNGSDRIFFKNEFLKR